MSSAHLSPGRRGRCDPTERCGLSTRSGSSSARSASTRKRSTMSTSSSQSATSRSRARPVRTARLQRAGRARRAHRSQRSPRRVCRGVAPRGSATPEAGSATPSTVGGDGPSARQRGGRRPGLPSQPFERSKSLESSIWLVTHRDGRAVRARTGLWELDVRDATFANVVSDARRAMARHVPPPDDDEWLRRTMTDELSLHAGRSPTPT